MESFQILEIKHSIGGKLIDGELVEGRLLTEALPEVSRINTKKYKRVRIIFEFEFDDQGHMKDSVEIRARRPWE